MTDMSGNLATRGTYSWIPWAFAGAFLVVVGVNMTMVWLATHTFPGLVVEHPYERGLAYEKVIAERSRQVQSGWRFDAALVPLAGGARLTVTLSGADGAAPPVSKFGVLLSRPLLDRADMPAELIADGGGQFSAIIPDLAAGQWTLRVDLDSAGGPLIFDKRLILQ